MRRYPQEEKTGSAQSQEEEIGRLFTTRHPELHRLLLNGPIGWRAVETDRCNAVSLEPVVKDLSERFVRDGFDASEAPAGLEPGTAVSGQNN
jgi:hypothetical protein